MSHDQALRVYLNVTKQLKQKEQELDEANLRIKELESLISAEPWNKTSLPPEFQRLWESCVRLSDKAEFKVVFRHLEHLSESYTVAVETLAKSLHIAHNLDYTNMAQIAKWLDLSEGSRAFWLAKAEAAIASNCWAKEQEGKPNEAGESV